LLTAVGWTAPTSLLNAAGDKPVYSPQAARYFPDAARLPENVLVTGGIAGDGSVEELTAHAVAVGAEAARCAARTAAAWIAATPTTRGPGGPARPATAPGTGATDPEAATGTGAEESVRHIPELPVDEDPALFAGRTNGFVDFSEDASAKDLRATVAEGFRGAELAKRFTTATMGPLQGKLETVNTVAGVAAATGATIAETGPPPGRPPYVPITLGALAGRAFEPVRYS